MGGGGVGGGVNGVTGHAVDGATLHASAHSAVQVPETPLTEHRGRRSGPRHVSRGVRQRLHRDVGGAGERGAGGGASRASNPPKRAPRRGYPRARNEAWARRRARSREARPGSRRGRRRRLVARDDASRRGTRATRRPRVWSGIRAPRAARRRRGTGERVARRSVDEIAERDVARGGVDDGDAEYDVAGCRTLDLGEREEASRAVVAEQAAIQRGVRISTTSRRRIPSARSPSLPRAPPRGPGPRVSPPTRRSDRGDTPPSA